MIKTIKDYCIEYWRCFRTVTLPPALNRLKINRLIAAAAIVFACIIACVLMKNFSFMIGLILAVYLIYTALQLSYNYEHGNINELHLICKAGKIKKNQTNVVFEDKDGNTYSLFYPKKIDIYESVKYIVYTYKINEKMIIAIQEE